MAEQADAVAIAFLHNLGINVKKTSVADIVVRLRPGDAVTVEATIYPEEADLLALADHVRQRGLKPRAKQIKRDGSMTMAWEMIRDGLSDPD